MELWTQSDWYIELMLNALLFILPTIAVVAGTGELGSQVIKYTRAIWDAVRPAIDQPTDPAILYIAAKSKREPAEVSDLLVKIGDEIVELLPNES